MAITARAAKAGDRADEKRSKSSQLFGEIANVTSRAAGRAPIFVAAVAVVLIWAVTGPLFGFSDTWQLVINTGTTQNRDGAAIQAKLDELIRASTARNSFVGIEHLTDEELDDIRARCENLAKAEKISEEAVRLTGKKAGRAADRVTD
jgi:low affinity Fe/Cu permease